ncbi:MAG: sulfite exporter TauE/SafE family protein [Bacteroidetes bacterium]|nr:MAG: sulfite exporter TauE/SafE family protein [Bacteroidota bacterium]
MDFQELIEPSAYLLAGTIAGIINTFAGGGSIFTLSSLLFFEMPAHIANGTNRLGILVQNLSGTITFYRHGLLDFKANFPYMIPCVLGAIIGAFIAVYLDHSVLEKIVGIELSLTLLSMLYKSKKNTNNTAKPTNKNKRFLKFLAIGLYGGIAQLGMAIILTLALSKSANLSLVRANAVKMAIIFMYMIPVFSIFVYHDLVSWMPAIWLALGQIIGTSIASKFANSNPNVNIWIKKILILMIVSTILKVVGFWAFLINLFT